MQTRVVVAPEEEPVTLAEAKRQANVAVDFEDDDAYISGLIVASRTYLEDILGRAFVTRTLETTFDWPLRDHRWPGGCTAAPKSYRLPRAPVQAIVEAGYTFEGEAEVLDPSLYAATTGTPAILRRVAEWPTGFNLTVRYVAGYGDAADVPETAKLAIKMLAAHWYDRREVVAQGVVSPLPFAVDALCDSLRWGGMAG